MLLIQEMLHLDMVQSLLMSVGIFLLPEVISFHFLFIAGTQTVS